MNCFETLVNQTTFEALRVQKFSGVPFLFDSNIVTFKYLFYRKLYENDADHVIYPARYTFLGNSPQHDSTFCS